MSQEPQITEPQINKQLVEYAYANLENIPKGAEYEKMILGIPYNCFDRDLWLKRTLAHEQAADFGNIRMKDFDFDFDRHGQARSDYLATILGKCSPKTFIEPPFYVDYGCNVLVGDSFYANFNLVLLDCSLITFGDRVLIGPNCTFTTATHPTDPQLRADCVESAHPIKVGSDVWFGSNVVVLPGVEIGDGAVVGAGSVVTKSVPPNTVAVGSPARVIKHLKPKDDKKAEFAEVA